MSPCPFCGSEKSELRRSGWFVAWYFVLCLACLAQGPKARLAKVAEILWDKRP